MKKTLKRILAAGLMLGLLGVLAASGQIAQVGDPTTEEKATNLPLLIAINRMEMTPTQLRQMHDILVGVLDEAQALGSDREEFEQEMLRFNGSSEELENLLEEYREEAQDKATAFQGSLQGALDEITQLLTLKQGQILAQAVPGFGQVLQMTKRPELGERMTEELRGGVRERIRERLQGRVAPEIQQRLPQLLGRLGERLPLQGGQIASNMAMRRRFMGNVLSILEQLADVLEAKLGYIE